MRGLLDAVAVTNPPPDLWRTASDLTRALTQRFAIYEVAQADQAAVRHADLPDRGQLLLSPLRLLSCSEREISGLVVFGGHHFGSNESAHGGAISLIFDELFGRLANSGTGARMRTAYLHVNYRAVTPLACELSISVQVTKVLGRKLFASGSLRNGKQLLADSKALLVALRPGQP
jgi:acyl-coenzyme A thioesterase PaaI-like protein